MPKGVYIRTKQVWNKGKKLPYEVWNKGKKGVYSAEVLQKMIEGGRKGGLLVKRKPFSNEHKNKLSKYFKDNPVNYWKGKHLSLQTREKIRIKLRSNTKLLSESIKSLLEGQNWRKQVFERDDYTCQRCFERGYVLNAHHKKEFALILRGFLQEYNQFSPIEDRDILIRLAINYKPFWDITNGETVCKKCHKSIKHKRIYNG